MNNKFFASVATAGLLLVAGCVNPAIKVPLQAQRTWNFADGVRFDCHFSGARLGGCERIGEREYKLLVTPENQPINPSPWYAFKVSARTPQVVTIQLVYTSEGPRGRPSISRDGTHWTVISTDCFSKGPDGNSASIVLQADSRPTLVATWEVLALPQIHAWADKMCRLPFVREESAGRSIEARSLRAFVVGETTNANYVFVIGRQHPPEITGTMGLMSFVETVADDSALAREFRKHFRTIVVPVVNPDGVERGHWRSNLGGVDLNRDWRTFSQRETAELRDWILHYAHQPLAHPALFLDFHSTSTNIFYAVPEQKGDVFTGFTDHWLAALRQDCPTFSFERDDTHNANEATSKAWANAALHVPSITCEFGYRTDRVLIREAARVEAEEMMRLLLVSQQAE